MSITTPTIISLVDETTASKPMIMGLSDIMEYLRTLYDVDSSIEEFPEKIMSLMKDSYDKNGLKKWYNFYQPLVGTDTFINFVLNTIKIESDIVPWYETSNPTNTFDLVLSQYSEGLDREKFLETINFYKNIESKLASMRLKDCPMRFALDSSKLDEDLLSDTSGVDIRGTTFCFRIKHQIQSFVNDPNYQYSRVSSSSFRKKYFDNTVLGDFHLNTDIMNERDLYSFVQLMRNQNSYFDLNVPTWETMDSWNDNTWDEETSNLANGYVDFRVVVRDSFGLFNIVPNAYSIFTSIKQPQEIININDVSLIKETTSSNFTNIYDHDWGSVSGWAFGSWVGYKVQIYTNHSTEVV